MLRRTGWVGRGPAPTIAFISLVFLIASPAFAQQTGARRVEIRFIPTARAQLAIWIESADGQRFTTIGLTDAVAVRGIGNRPGATQMNSGYRWPYGRREGVLPVWGHRRIERGGRPFERVIFNQRASEGNASSAGSSAEPRNTRDDYFCLSFDRERSGRDQLDATTCASIFNSNKGRYIQPGDVGTGYAEPWEDPGRAAMMRPMTLTSIYPPRRDVIACTTAGCGDHEDVIGFDADVRSVLPEIDAVTMATPGDGRVQRIVLDVPESWPDGEYVAYIEVNTEGDYNDAYSDVTNPTPIAPEGEWDYWAINYGYAYRGQPSIVYSVPFTVSPGGGQWRTRDPLGYGALHGENGDIVPIDGTISGDVAGSGVDRLYSDGSGYRVTVTVPQWNICEQPDPPVECGYECQPGDDTCGAQLICGPQFTCVGLCDVPMQPGTIDELTVMTHPDEKLSHHYARLSFRVPASARRLMRYEMRVGREPIVDEASFERALPAVEPNIERIELVVPTDGAPGELVELSFGGLIPETEYYVAIRAIDECNAPGEIAVAQVTTTPIHFTTVSPCFVATAAYGTPLEPRIGVLRRFRDRHLRTNVLGRALVAVYETVGPHLADVIREDEDLRAAARAVLDPIVSWLE
jgi:hypothetical protein